MHGRPLLVGADVDVPRWYRTVVQTCLADDPRLRAHAIHLLAMFPDPEVGSEEWARRNPPSNPADEAYSAQEPFVDGRWSDNRARVTTTQQPNDWSNANFGHTYVDPPSGMSNEPYYFTTRGRSPPSPMPSNPDPDGDCDSSRRGPGMAGAALLRPCGGGGASLGRRHETRPGPA